MKKILIVPVLFLGVSFFLLKFVGNNAFAEAEIQTWSVEKTIKTVREVRFSDVCSVTSVDRGTYLNPDARPEMHRILNDKNEAKIWGNVVIYFGALGQEEDVQKLLGLIEKYKGTTLDNYADDMVFGSISAMSMMENRGIKGAGDAMDKMITPEYWQSLDIKYTHGNLGPMPVAGEYAPRAARCKSYSGDPKAKEKVQAVCDRIQDLKLKRAYAYQVKTMTESYDDFMAAKKSGDWKAYYAKKDQEFAQAQENPVPVKSTPKVVMRRSENVYSELWFHTGVIRQERWTKPTSLTQELDAKLSKEALEEFDRTIKACLKQDNKYWLTHMAHWGRPLLLPDEQTPEKIEKYLKESPNLCQQWASRFPAYQEFVDKAPKPAEHSVFLLGFPADANKATSRTLSAEAVKDPKKHADLIVIRFSL